jgi:sec-independent protein translocase protein TatA
MPSIGPLELVIILGILLVVVGPTRLPHLGSAVGKTIKNFRSEVDAPTQPPAAELAPGTSAPSTDPVSTATAPAHVE